MIIGIENSSEAMASIELVRAILERFYRESLEDLGKAEIAIAAITETDRTLTYLRKVKDGAR